jgi:RsmE family RNA methyltransferase
MRHDNMAYLRDARAAHVRTVLRAVPGDMIRVGIVDGRRGTAVVDSLDDQGVVLRCSLHQLPSPPPAIDVLLALPRPKVMRRLFAQLAALGVGRILLTNASRVERHYFDTHVLTPACYRPLLVEGLQQARDTHLPRVSIHRQFRVLLEDVLGPPGPSTLRVVAHPGVDTRLHTAVGASPAPRLLLALGPEGGWNEFEMALLHAHGFSPISLGVRTLRSDTACVALLALAHDALDARTARLAPARSGDGLVGASHR